MITINEVAGGNVSMMKKKLIKTASKVTQTHLHEGSTKLAEQGADRHNHRY